MNEQWYTLTHKLEQMEIDFLNQLGVNAIYQYNDIQNHIDKMADEFNEEFDEYLSMNPRQIEDALQELEDKRDAIDSASANLSDLKRLVQSMRKSEMKDNLMDCIERMECDLC